MFNVVSNSVYLKSSIFLAIIKFNCVCVSVSGVPGIPFFYDWLHFHCGVVGFQPLVIIIFKLLNSLCFLQVCTTSNMWSRIGDDIIHAYMQLPVDIIPTSMKFTYIHISQ